jgi:hypothetical protein
MSSIPLGNSTNVTISRDGGLGDWASAPRDQPEPGSAENPHVLTATDGTKITIDPETGITTIGGPSVRRSRGKSNDFDMNLAEIMEPRQLGALAGDILDGVRWDDSSRREFIDNYNSGIDLLGLKIEKASSSQRGPRRSISKYKHPGLLEACVGYQSKARSQLLPSSGPVKIVEVESGDEATQTRALDFQNMFNHYFTDIAKEYYPDMDKGLFYQGYGGTVYKKVFHCPIRRRPASDCVYLPSLIVSEDAVDLNTAARVTHEIMMVHAQLRRMQINGAWLDVRLGMPQGDQNLARRKEKQSTGVSPNASRPQDMPYTIYETTTDFDPVDYGLDEYAPEGLPLPYRVTVDRDSMQILEVRRKWRDGDEEFMRRQQFIKYGLVPGLGFLDYGYLHLVGNQTRALTALWQLVIDSGMLANFPGGIKMKNARMSTNELTMGLGEFLDVDVPMAGGNSKLSDFFMTMPYKDISPAAIQLVQIIEESIQRMGSTAEIDVGEGRTNVPVGTVMAMIEQATQTEGAIHKRNWTAQKQEIMALRELFLEDPVSLWKLNPNPERRPETVEEFEDLTLSPFSDPQVPSQIHRIMQAQTLEQMAAMDPVTLNRAAIHMRAFNAMGIADGASLINPPPPPGAGAPQAPPMNPADALKAQAAMAKVQADTQNKSEQAALEVQKLDSQAVEQQREAASQLMEGQQRDADRQAEQQTRAAELQLEREKIAAQERQHHATLHHQATQAAHDRVMDRAKHQDGLASASMDRQQAAAVPASGQKAD